VTFRSRTVGFGVVVAVCLLTGTWYFFHAVRENEVANVPEGSFDASPAQLTMATGSPHVLFRNTDLGGSYGKLSVAPLPDPEATRYATSLRCERVDFAGGTGICLAAHRGIVTTYEAQIFDRAFQVTHTVSLAGVPSRARVAPDGSVAATTVFVSGHAYEISGFSTRTSLIDTRAGRVVADLEDFAVTREGKVFKAADFNFWGVTFTRDSRSFFATLSSGGTFYLVRGDVASKRASVIGEGVECPALSPDNTRLAYKKRVVENGRLTWHLAVRPVGSSAERVLAGETRSIDDQVEWLDNHTILYGASDDQLGPGRTSVWMIDVDNGGSRKWLSNAFSPSVF
jgi:hypothetical protein